MYLRDVLFPAFPDTSAEKKLVIVCDGHGISLADELLEVVRYMLPVQATSFVLQSRHPDGEECIQGHVHRRRIFDERALGYRCTVTERSDLTS
jgi:hypothetical protein